MQPSEYQEAQRVARLIAGFIGHQLTEAQHAELDAWIGDSDANMQLFEQLTDEKNIEFAHAWFSKLDVATARLKVGQRIANQDKSPRPVRWLLWGSAAAAVIVLIVGLIVFNYSTAPSAVVPVAVLPPTDSILPGGFKATLLTGTHIRLDLSALPDQSITLGGGAQAHNGQDVLTYDSRSPLDTSWNTLEIPAGGQYQVVLADGTKVWLNAASSLTYPVHFSGSHRKVLLTGEGYFDVARQATQPFVVELNHTAIQVLGTRFNASSYVSDSIQKISLVEGSIRVVTNKQQRQLKPAEEAILGGNQFIVSTATHPEDATAWTKGLFSFHASSVHDALAPISRWYNISVTYEGPLTKTFTGQIYRNASLEQVLDILESSGVAHFSLHNYQLTVRSP